jgi:hypothetical protein
VNDICWKMTHMETMHRGFTVLILNLGWRACYSAVLCGLHSIEYCDSALK